MSRATTWSPALGTRVCENNNNNNRNSNLDHVWYDSNLTYIRLLPSINNLWRSLFFLFQAHDMIMIKWSHDQKYEHQHKKLVEGSPQTSYSHSHSWRLWVIIQSQTENDLISCQSIIQTHQTDLMNTSTTSEQVNNIVSLIKIQVILDTFWHSLKTFSLGSPPLIRSEVKFIFLLETYFLINLLSSRRFECIDSLFYRNTRGSRTHQNLEKTWCSVESKWKIIAVAEVLPSADWVTNSDIVEDLCSKISR